MYFKGSNFTVNNRKVFMKQGAVLSGATYFNSFSMGKWLKYTIVENVSVALTLKGKFDVSVYKMDVDDDSGETVHELLINVKFDSVEKREIILPCETDNGIVYWKLIAESDNSQFFGGYYLSDVPTEKIRDIRLAIGTCTFCREEYITANVNNLKKAISSPDSPLFGNVKVFISDNGQTLPIDEIEDTNVKIVYNKNLGGAGGFTRCLIEALAVNAQNQFTNFIFMDDDIVLDIHAVEKTFVFLSLLKDCHINSVIGGAMFSIDDKFKQFENGAKWQGTGFRFNRRDVDMRDAENIILNERDYDINYNAWCYCCIPFDVIKENNLPIPIFFHMDDVEYSLRNGLPVITLNGINVWHLYKKGIVNAKNDYYDVRNKLIMLSEISPKLVGKMAHIYLNSFTLEVFKHHYARAINAFHGILDFCKGFDYFRTLDTMEKHKKLFNNTVWTDASPIIRKRAVASTKYVQTRSEKFKAAIRIVMRTKKRRAYVLMDNSVSDGVKARKVVVYNPKENKSIEYKKSLYYSLVCYAKYRKTLWAIEKKLPQAVKEFNRRITEVQTIDFWNRYLGLPFQEHKFRVLFVASDNNATSGAFRSMVALCMLLKNHFETDTYVLLPKHGDGAKLLRANNIPYSIIDSEDWIVHLTDTDETIKRKTEKMQEVNSLACIEMENFLKREKFNVIHINTSYHYVIAEVAKKFNIPVVWHIREFLEEDQSRRFIDKEYAHSLMKSVNKTIAISDSIHDKYRNALFKNIVRIYNGIDETIYFDKEKKIFTEDKLVFTCVGILAEYKGQHLLLEACGKLKENGFDNFEIQLIGDNVSTYMIRLKEITSRYGIADKVRYLGRRNDVHEFYKKTDIMFVCSRSEAFGRITVEAMMSGCLVIGANTAGTKEIINDGINGVLFEAENSADLYDKIVYATCNKELMKEIASCGRKDALEKYSAMRNAEEIYSLYQKL